MTYYSDKIETIGYIADHNAEQVRNILGIDQTDANLLVKDIQDEKMVDRKVSKLLKLLIDRLSTLNRGLHSNETVLDQKQYTDFQSSYKIKSLNDLYNPIRTNSRNDAYSQGNTSPTTKRSIIEEIDKSRSLSSMQSQIAEDLQEQLLDVQDQLTKLRQKYINSDKPKLEDKNEVSIKKYNDLKVKYQKLKSIDVHLKKEIQDLKSSISETSKISKLTQDSVSEGINPLKIQNDSIIDSPENGMSSEYSQNSANHNNFSKELKVERHRRINAQKEIIALKKNIKDLQQKLKSKEEKETTNDDIEILNQRADKAENEVLVQKALYSQLKQNYDTLMQTISVLRSENAAMLDEKGKLFEKISSLEKSVRTSANESIEKDAYRLKYSDSLCEKRNIEQKFEEAQTEIKRLNHEIIRLEAMLTKTKDENYKNTETIKVYENDMLTLSRYGFLLADALGQRFNPQNVEIEIERLLEIVKEEHQEYMMFHPPQYRETCSECGRPLY